MQVAELPNWNELRTRITKLVRDHRLGTVIGIAVGAAFIPITTPFGLMPTIFAVLAWAIATVLLRSRWSQLKAGVPQTNGQAELTTFLRSYLDSEIRSSKAVRFAMPLLTLVVSALVIWKYDTSGPLFFRWALVSGFVVVSSIALSIYTHVVALPKLRRQRAELD